MLRITNSEYANLKMFGENICPDLSSQCIVFKLHIIIYPSCIFVCQKIKNKKYIVALACVYVDGLWYESIVQYLG